MLKNLLYSFPLLLLTCPAVWATPLEDNFDVVDANFGILQGQVTSVSQFSNVQPTDWAFGALQSLVERYSCIAGYPNSTNSRRSSLRDAKSVGVRLSVSEREASRREGGSIN